MKLSKFQWLYLLWSCICLLGYFIGGYYLDIDLRDSKGEDHLSFIAYVLNFFLWFFLWGIPTFLILLSLLIDQLKYYLKKYF